MKTMKDSGISWIGEIPEDWDVGTIGRNYTLRSVKVSDKDFEPLSVTKNGILKQLENVAKSNASDDRKQVLVDDFVINSRSDRKQSCGVSLYDGSVSLINIVLKHSGDISPEYTKYLLDNWSFAEEFFRWGTGIVADLWSTKWDLMKRIMIPMPNIKRQKQISLFLNNKIDYVAKLIELENKLIEELKAYKQSLITEVVTGQTIISKDQNDNWQKSIPQSTKSSGIDWIGEIPSAWEIVRFKNYFNLRKGLNITKENLVENGYPVVNYGQVHSKSNTMIGVSSDIIKFVPIEYLDGCSSCLVEPDGFIFADTSEDYEGCGNFVYNDGKESIFAGYHTIITECKIKQSCRYFAYLFQTNIWRSPIRTRVSGVKVLSISQAILRNIFLLLPIYEEQQLIAEYLDEKCSQIDKLIQIKENKIKELNEYKKSIIYEYVTGKKEVV